MQADSSKKFYRDQWVEVRSAAEIAATLDANGMLDGMPFMPEMLAFCGRRIRVHRRADRTCVGDVGFRHLRASVFLHETRCDGRAHDHCERGCLLFWKEVWLKPAAASAPPRAAAPAAETDAADAADAAARTCITRSGERYICQSTELVNATTGAFSRWDARPLLRDILHGELRVGAFLDLVARTVLNRLGRGRNKPLLGQPGKKERGQLDLREGDWVNVKSASEITEQLDPKGANCGMMFRPTMQAAIGGRFQVAFPVRRIIIEESGKMVQLKNTVALKGVTCQGPCVANCPRNEYLYWRESWLTRADGEAPASPPR